MKMRKSINPDALDGLTAKFAAGNVRRRAMLDHELVNARAAHLICDMRTAGGLTQRALAGRIGTTASVICRLEAADYSGHTLAMLNRTASALGRRIELHAVPREAA
jgi:ribosome-binding protein aMBF1 (putative translation factor)